MEYFSIIISFILGEGCGWEVKCETRAGWQVRAVTVPRVGAQSLGGGARQGGRAGPGLSKSQRPGSHSDVPRGTSGSLECPCEHPVGPGSCEEGLGPTEAWGAENPKAAGGERPPERIPPQDTRRHHHLVCAHVARLSCTGCLCPHQPVCLSSKTPSRPGGWQGAVISVE